MTSTESLTLPPRQPMWPDLTDDVGGFHGQQAVDTAAAMWPNVPKRLDVIDADINYADDLIIDQRSAPDDDDDPAIFVNGLTAKRRAALVIAPGLLRVKWANTGPAGDDLCGLGCACCAHEPECGCDRCIDDETENTMNDLFNETDNSEGVIREFSARSKGRMMCYIASVDWAGLRYADERLVMLTWTYPGDWRDVAPTPQVAVEHLNSMAKKFKRDTGRPLRCVWVREFQKRGAPHFHLLASVPDQIKGRSFAQWQSQAWFETVGSGDERHLEAGTRIDYEEGLRASIDPKRAAAYFGGYTSKDKGYQTDGPDGWTNDNGSIGAFWGRRGLRTATAEVALTPDDVIQIKRVIRNMIRAQKRTAPRRVARQVETNYLNTDTGELITAAAWCSLTDGGQSRHIPITTPGSFRTVNRRWRLRSLTPQGPAADGQRGFAVFANDAPLLAVQLARLLHSNQPPWPKGQRRPLP